MYTWIWNCPRSGKNHKSASLMSRIEEEATEECDNCGEMMVDCTCMEEDFEQPEEFWRGYWEGTRICQPVAIARQRVDPR